MVSSADSAKSFRSAVERRDLEGMLAALSDDIVLHSPVTFRPFEGKDAVRMLFGVLLNVFEDFSYVDEFHEQGRSVLLFEARVGGRELQGIDLVRTNPEGLIEDFTVMVRPLSAVLALAEAAGSQLGVGP